MIDIITHRARIGTFNAYKHRKVKPKSNLEYGTQNVLISIFMIITVMAAASQGLYGVAAPKRTD